MPSTSARARPPQVWCAGTSVDEEVHEHGLVLARLRERGIAGEAHNLAYFEWSIGLHDDEGNELRPEQVTPEMVADKALWRQVYAALGTRISVEHFRLSPTLVARESCHVSSRPSFEGYKSRMVATGHMLSSAQPEIVSPELVLVDPRLATDARGLLSDPDDTVARLEQQSSLDPAEPPLPVESVDPGSSADEEVAGALRRLTELSEVEPPKRRRLRLSRLRRRGARSPSS
jgi:hypothetical protein